LLTTIIAGPVSATGFPIHPELRYTRDMFEEPSPQIVPGARFHPASSMMSQYDPPHSEKMLSAMSKPLKPTGQGPSGAIDFFGQGILLGVTVYLLPIALISIGGVATLGTLAFRWV
jgi:hypothetical protein